MTVAPIGRIDVVVVGGGIIGLFAAWRAQARGMTVRVLDAGTPGDGASHVAAGMLAPISEAEFGEAGRRLLRLGLAEASGQDAGYRESGTMVLARDADEAEALEREQRFRDTLGLPVERLLPSAARRAEPALAPTLRAALDIP